MSGPQDARIQDVFGPKLYLETGNPAGSDYGPEAFAMKSTNDEGCRFILACLLYTSPSPRDGLLSRMPSSA